MRTTLNLKLGEWSHRSQLAEAEAMHAAAARPREIEPAASEAFVSIIF